MQLMRSNLCSSESATESFEHDLNVKTGADAQMESHSLPLTLKPPLQTACVWTAILHDRICFMTIVLYSAISIITPKKQTHTQ